MVRRGRVEEPSGSISCLNKSILPMAEASESFNRYPPCLARYEEVAANPTLFMNTLEQFHGSMRTKFMIPIIGGKELDLHRLFVEVTSRGGFEKILREKRWKEITAVFNFPTTATNASFVLRKYYASLLHHYEQLYYFKAKGWSPIVSESMQSPSSAPAPMFQEVSSKQPSVNTSDFFEARPASNGSPVIGIIDGKFESGYLVTVSIGSERLKGVLYQAPPYSANMVPPNLSVISSNNNNNVTSTSGVHRRRRRKKSEIKRRDPAHPKPNRSGYNFFFAEQHARLKPLHPGKDREISRMIGELWNKLKESDRAVYQEKAVLDKERYRTEMIDYRERLRMGQHIIDAMPLQQRFPLPSVDMVEADEKTEETEGGDSGQSLENDSSCKSDTGDDRTMEIDTEESPQAYTSNQLCSMGIESCFEQQNNRVELGNLEKFGGGDEK